MNKSIFCWICFLFCLSTMGPRGVSNGVIGGECVPNSTAISNEKCRPEIPQRNALTYEKCHTTQGHVVHIQCTDNQLNDPCVNVAPLCGTNKDAEWDDCDEGGPVDP